MRKKAALSLVALMLLSACTGVKGRIQTAQDLQQEHNYLSYIYETPDFPLYSAIPYATVKNQPIISVVIEGDGYAWISKTTLSGDPTPKDPVALKMALSLDKGMVYLARPCQYVRAAQCDRRYWSTDRFASDVLRSYDTVLTQIKAQYGTPGSTFRLYGFSGGAYVAFNLAAMRTDVEAVTTIAGLISPEDWTAFHGITPLRVTTATQHLFDATSHVRFTHICSNSDKVLPCDLTAQILQRYESESNNHSLIPVEASGHETVWENAVALLKKGQQ